MEKTDIAIIGAGPAGLYASYYAGFRGFSVTLIDALEEIGGQVTAMYPEKEIFDIAGFPSVKGRELIDGLWAQASQFPIQLKLGEQAVELTQSEDSVLIRCESGLEVQAKAVVITGGIGSFSPRPLPVGMQWLNRGLVHFVKQLNDHEGKDVVIVGGGDSAFDWAYSLHPIAKSVTLIHRRPEFRAHAATVEKVKSLGVKLIPSAELVDIKGSETITNVTYKSEESTSEIPAQTVIAALGFVANIGPMASWGLNLEKRRILVDTRMETNIPRVFAAGDLATYFGKVPLISVGFGEAATAINNAAPYVQEGVSVFPGHSSGGSE
jgi:ferredoxin/flavodoxin---NADP+ reductase